MNPIFKKCKAKILREYFLKVFLLSLSIALIVGGVLIVLTKLLHFDFPLYASILIGVGTGILFFLLFFFLRKPNDEKIAERIDKEFHLQEKVTSMVAFQDEKGILYEKQREDALTQLSKQDSKKLPFKVAAINIPALVFGASLFTASFFTPTIEKAPSDSDKDTGEKQDDINEKTQEIIDEMQQLITNSSANEELKKELTDLLNELIESLKDDTDVDSRKKKVQDAETKVDEALAIYNTREEIGAALEKTEIDLISKLGTAIKNGDTEGVKTVLTQLEKHFAPHSVYTEDDLIDHMELIADTITGALKEVIVPTFDDLYQSLKHLTNTFNNLARKYSLYLTGDTEQGINEEQAKADAITAIERAIDEITVSLTAQEENKALADSIKEYMEELINPQGGKSDDKTDDNDDKDEEDSDDDDKTNEDQNDKDEEGDDKKDEEGDDSQKKDDSDESNGQEGDQTNTAGSGETNYGSDDKVYTDENGYSSYGDVIDGYHNDAISDNEENGDSELGDILDDYYNSLYGSNNDDNNP